MKEMKTLNGYEIVDGKARAEIDLIKGVYVTPEMFGAVGDGVADDTEAVQSCLDGDIQTVFATKTYKITRPLLLTKSKTITGGGTFYAPSSDKRFYMFTRYEPFDEPISYFEVNNIHFESVREHECARTIVGDFVDGSLYSNVTFISLRNYDSVYIKNTTFKNADCALFLDSCNNVVVDGFKSLYSTQTVYAQGNNKITITNGYSEFYDLVHTSAHHIYICYGNDDVLIDGVKMINPNHAGEYPVHVYASADQIADYGLTRKVAVRNCYIEHGNKTIASAMVSEKFEMDSCVCKCLDETKNGGFYYCDIEGYRPIYEIRNTTFTHCAGFRLDGIMTGNVGDLKFTNCKIEGVVRGYADMTETIEFDNCQMLQLHIEETTTPSPILVKNCSIIHPSNYALRIRDAIPIKLVNCYLHANYGDGVIAVQNVGADVTLIGCYGENDGGTKFEYNGSHAPTVKVYNCTFPTLTLRRPADFIEKNNVWAE